MRKPTFSINEVIGNIKIIEHLGLDHTGLNSSLVSYWLVECQCKCKSKIRLNLPQLKRIQIKGWMRCKECNKPPTVTKSTNFISIPNIGEKVGNLTIVNYESKPRINKDSRKILILQCDCGNIRKITSDSLRRIKKINVFRLQKY